MRMSVESAGDLLEAAEQAAKERHTTLRALVDDGLERVLHDDETIGGTAFTADEWLLQGLAARSERYRLTSDAAALVRGQDLD
jgi:hypothetical protein